MHRRDFLKGTLAIGTVAITDPASAQTRLLTLREFIRLKFCRGFPCTRRNIHALLSQNPNHPTIAAYKTAVATMKALPDNDPTSWAYQANIHGTTLLPSQWPPGAPFATCTHSLGSTITPHFLSWHRMYLAFFERIIRKHSSQPNFCLPYWNYETSGQAALPAPFRSPANVSNPLWDGSRNASVNAGGNIFPGSSSNSLARTSFLGLGEFQITLEGTPHGTVHGAVGGNMGNFAGAGRDPIFWLHHCNIDRLWEKWLSLGNGRTNPIGDSNWMNQTYTFVDENGQFVTMTVADVLDTVTRLDYKYDDPSTCVTIHFVKVPIFLIAERFFKDKLLVIKLAKDLEIELSKRRTIIRLDDRKRAKEFSKLVNQKTISELSKNHRVVLNILGIQTEMQMDGFFEAYVNFGSPGEISVQKAAYVGNVSTFGADRKSRESMMRKKANDGQKMDDRAHGAMASIDITDALIKLSEPNSGNLSALSVTLVPSTGVKEEERKFSPKIRPRIGEISVEVIRKPEADQ